MHVENTHTTRHSQHFQNVVKKLDSTIACMGPKLWNSIIAGTCTRGDVPQSKDVIKKLIKNHFLSKY